MNVPYEFTCASIYDITEINSTFATGKLKIMYLGDNRNGTHFSKKAVENALPTLKNVPIVCHWDEEDGEIGGHDIALVSNSDGELKIKNLTEPCGVVPEKARFYFQTESDESGEEHEYLIADGVILWKRQDVYRHIVTDLEGKVKHSMEVHVRQGEMVDNLFDITDFEFTALCLLEKYEPCFEGSQLELYTMESFKRKMEQMLMEMKECFGAINTPDGDADIVHPQKFTKEGGNKVLEDKKDLLARYGVDESSLDFSIDDFTVEELTEKFEAMKENDTDNGDNGAQDEGGNSENAGFALTSNIIDEINRALDGITIQREWGECHRYWYVDCDLDACEIYCWDTEDWLLYGFTYTVNGDSVVIDFDSKKRKKYVIEDFDGGEQESPFAAAFSMMEQKILDNAGLEAKYQNASDKISVMEAELNELRQFKTETETKRERELKDGVFALFTDLVGNESFEALRDHRDEYSADVIEEKCYAIRGRNADVKFSLENKTPKIPVGKTDTNTEPYGGLFAKYGVETID